MKTLLILIGSVLCVSLFFWNLDWFTKAYMTRAHCMFMQPELIGAYLIANAGIAVAYFSIPRSLFVLVKKDTNLLQKGIFWQFIVFILLCGLNHVFDVMAVFYAMYRLDVFFRCATMIASLRTAWLLPKVIAEVLEIRRQAMQYSTMKTELEKMKGDYNELIQKIEGQNL